ncbi:MAG: hypothetical protein HY262_08920 [Chloroflexi bacterium]|nr:hypothetical protein [Chloroflexota bacterium]
MLLGPRDLAPGAQPAHDLGMTASPLSPRKPSASPSPLTGRRVATLIAGWLVVASLAAPALGLYYEARASLYLLAPLMLIYAYCFTHRRRATALLALIATVVVGLGIGLALVIPKAASALAS